MTPFRHFSNKGLRPQLSLQRGAFFLTVSSLLALHTGCGQSYETVETKTPTTGVITVLDETSEQEFSIAEERIVPAVEDSRIIVNYLDGRHDTLNVDQAKSLHLHTADTTIYHGHNHAMGNVLWWGTMGYFMGRSMNSPINPGVYRNQQTYQNSGAASSSYVRSSTRTTYTQRPVSGRSGFFSSSRGSSGG